MSLSPQEIDDAAHNAISAEVADIHASDDLLDRIHDRVAEAPARGRARRRGSWAAAAVVLVALGAVGVVTAVGDPDEAPVTAGPGGGAPTVLPVPEVGDAAAEVLADGTPVWVVHHEDGGVTVVDATSSHRPFGIRSLIGWCEASRGFVEGQNGSLFDERGRKRAGPAPRHLDTYATTLTDGGAAVEVGELILGEDRTVPPLATPTENGGHCVGAAAEGSGYNPGSTDLHDFDAADALPVSNAPADSNGDLVLFDSTTLLLRPGVSAVVCLEPLDAPSDECDGPGAPDLELPSDGTTTTITGSFLARVRSGSLYDISFVRGWVSQPSAETTPAAGSTTEAAQLDRLVPPYTTALNLLDGPSVSEFLDVRSCAEVEAASVIPLHQIAPPPDGTSTLCFVEHPDLERPSNAPPEDLGVSVLYVPQHLDPASSSYEEIVDAGGVLVHTSLNRDDIACRADQQDPAEPTCLPVTIGPHEAIVRRPETQRATVKWRTQVGAQDFQVLVATGRVPSDAVEVARLVTPGAPPS